MYIPSIKIDQDIIQGGGYINELRGYQDLVDNINIIYSFDVTFTEEQSTIIVKFLQRSLLWIGEHAVNETACIYQFKILSSIVCDRVMNWGMHHIESAEDKKIFSQLLIDIQDTIKALLDEIFIYDTIRHFQI